MTTRILVVDDVPEILDFARQIVGRLKEGDIELTTTSDAVHARRLVAAHAYSVVITDYRMPHADGLEVLRDAYERNPAGLRVLMTGYNEIPADIESVRAAHVDAYLQKPLPSQQLLLFLKDTLSSDPSAMADHRSRARAIEASDKVNLRISE